ncbi:MAG TPA: prepilin-type N-terminal cleavage/methylation domain-containing protein [Clostridia bacterium]|nr:prepilin-type N-terminal cleavage/methylation domain-containing protein [Clostridia bacterium]
MLEALAEPTGRNCQAASLTHSAAKAAFTMIELILVMAILTIALSLTAPALASFFRGRSLDSEARRLLAVTRQGQSRAVSEGVPIELWVDTQQGKYGLEAEPSYEPKDPRGVVLDLASDMRLEALNGYEGDHAPAVGSIAGANGNFPVQVLSTHPALPKIRFLPDGTISETSPTRLRLTGREDVEIWLIQSTNRLQYEIRNRLN